MGCLLKKRHFRGSNYYFQALIGHVVRFVDFTEKYMKENGQFCFYLIFFFILLTRR